MRSNKPSNKNIYRYSLTVGNDGKKGFSGLINYKIIQNLFLRICSVYNYSNGFRKNNFLNIENSNKKDEIFVRAKLLFTPNKHFSLLGTVISSDLNNGYDVWAPDNNDRFITYSDSEGEDSQNTNAGSLKLHYQFLITFYKSNIFLSELIKFIHMMEIGLMMNIGFLNMVLIQILKGGPTPFMIPIEEKEIIFPRKLGSQINNIPLEDFLISLMKKIKPRVIFLAV